jgi:hypothetical protein
MTVWPADMAGRGFARSGASGSMELIFGPTLSCELTGGASAHALGLELVGEANIELRRQRSYSPVGDGNSSTGGRH